MSAFHVENTSFKMKMQHFDFKIEFSEFDKNSTLLYFVFLFSTSILEHFF